MAELSCSPRIEILREYFRQIDLGEFPAHLFATDFEFYFPKFGVGRGLSDFVELGRGMSQAGNSIGHCHDMLSFIEAKHHVVVEGATYGTNIPSGRSWRGGESPGGRFSSIFEFDAQGLISRMFVYADPDYAGVDIGGFHWKRANPRW